MASTLPTPSDCCSPASCGCDTTTITSINALIAAQIAATDAQVQAYDNATALRTAPYWEGRVALLRGLALPGDGNGGVYDYDETSTTADNGVTVLKPSAIDAADPGRWIKRI